MKKLVEELKPVIYTVVLIWGIFIVSSILPFLKNFGIEPRTFFGLFGIFFAPFLHGSFGHIASNTVPLLILLSLVVLNYSKEIVTQAIVCIMVLGGGLVWLFARSSNHIGASGVIYGLAVFLVYAGIRQRDGKSVAIAIVTFLLYGGMIWGVMPFLTGSSVSWESHLFGGIAGGVAAHYLCGRKTR